MTFILSNGDFYLSFISANYQHKIVGRCQKAKLKEEPEAFQCKNNYFIGVANIHEFTFCCEIQAALTHIVSFSRAVASNRQTVANLPVVLFRLLVYSNHKHPNTWRKFNHRHCLSHIFFLGNASVIIFSWILPQPIFGYVPVIGFSL